MLGTITFHTFYDPGQITMTVSDADLKQPIYYTLIMSYISNQLKVILEESKLTEIKALK